MTWVRAASEDTPWWLAGSEFRVGTRNREQAKDLQRDTVSFAARTLREVCEGAAVDVERIRRLASVEPRGWVPVATARLLGLPADAVLSVYETRGHLGACGPIANLSLGQERGLLDGPGLPALYGQALASHERLLCCYRSLTPSRRTHTESDPSPEKASQF